jgi:ABC-type transport system involved in cytochrome c biogenesis permease subunit
MNDESWFYLFGYAFVIAACVGQIIYLTQKDARYQRAAFGCVALALLCIVGGLALRGASQGYWPPVSAYEYALAVIAATLLVYLLLERRAESPAGIAALIPALVLMSYWLILAPADMRLPHSPAPLGRNGWHVLHALSAALGYGALAVAGGMGAAYLVRSWRPGWERWLAPTEALDEAGSYTMRLGLPLMTLSVAAGGIWALLAWGAFWRWEARETWTLIIWLICLFYHHARGLPGRPGKRTALVSVIGLAVAAFALFGADWLAQLTAIEILPMR